MSKDKKSALKHGNLPGDDIPEWLAMKTAVGKALEVSMNVVVWLIESESKWHRATLLVVPKKATSI